MKKFNSTFQIGDLINKTAFGDMLKGNKMGQIIKHSTIFSFWNSIVGAKFAKFTKPYSIKYQKLYVSAKSPVIVQELGLYKTKILKNINTYSMPLGIEIKDIIFSYKNYCASVPEALEGVEDKPVEISNGELERVSLDSALEEEIEGHVQKIKFLNEKQKEDFSKKIASTYKAKLLRDRQ